MRIEVPFHEGELLVQERAGEMVSGRRNGGLISDAILKGALGFIEQQPFAAVGSRDREGNVWASLLFGPRGFMTAPDERTVVVNLDRSTANPGDPFRDNIEHDPEVGMLAIDLGTRRRLRINGASSQSASGELRLEVHESYPNCPKYIQRRHVTYRPGTVGRASPEPARGRLLLPHQRELIRSADTFFVASAHPERGVDGSHRGGNPGFVRWIDDRRIRIPDYPGNSMFNTLGNFSAYPRAGLVFLDFERNRTLQLIGRPEIRWDLDDPEEATGGTRRFWDLEIDRWVELEHPAGLGWELLDLAPRNP